MITTADARAHLRIDGTEQDAEVSQKLTMAEALVDAYIGSVVTGSPAEAYRQTHVAALDAAVLLALGDLWMNRESTAGDPLSPTVRNLLQLFRMPAYA